MKPKILLAAPTSTYKDYIFLDWFIHASNLTYPNYDILICDNSLDKSYAEKLRKMGINTLYVSPENKHSREYITESQNKLRQYFLEHKEYDIFVSLETDVFPPNNFIEKLLLADKKIISAPYFYRFGEDSNIILNYFVKKGEKYSTHHASYLDSLRFVNGNVKQVYECGIGCTLIAREILEKIKFKWEPGKAGFSDTHFYLDLWNAGYKNYLDTSILCRHYNMNWSTNIDHVLSTDVDVHK